MEDNVGKTILVVDDHRSVLLLVSEILEMNGYQVLQSGSGEEALELCRAHGGPIHLLLTDVVMPGLDGRDLADRVRAIRPETNVLFMSTPIGVTHASHPDPAWLWKPFTPAKLLHRVQSILGQSSG